MKRGQLVNWGDMKQRRREGDAGHRSRGIFRLTEVPLRVHITAPREVDANGAVAQLGARLTGSQEVRGSNPLSSTMFLRRVAVKAATLFLSHDLTAGWANPPRGQPERQPPPGPATGSPRFDPFVHKDPGGNLLDDLLVDLLP
jgi:hypothetical protein